MTSPQEITPKASGRRLSLNDEQLLCNKALESGEFDSVSDDEWVALCEKVAANSGKAAAESGDAQD